MQIFLSYHQENEKFVRKLHTSLTEWGYLTQLNGERDTLHTSSVVIGFITPATIHSESVLDEWGYALSTGKRLFLVWLEDINEAEMPERFSKLQRIDMRDNQVAGLNQLQSALQSESKLALSHFNAVHVSSIDNNQSRKSTDTNRSRMIEKVKVFWVDGVLEQSLHGVALIELGIEHSDNDVQNPWGTILRHEGYGDYQLPTSTDIPKIYDELNQQLLILGEPGSGKTTTLLQLAKGVISAAEQDPTHPIPVIFNLSSWADTRKSLTEWLVDELNTKYQVPRQVGKEWVAYNELMLLLDGLDEVDGHYRDECVAAINEFRAEHQAPIVVCSRIRDYQALSNRLNLNGAIVLQPLDIEQVDSYLHSLGEQMQGVRIAMTRDPDLRQLAESPLMLSIMTLAFYDLDEESLPVLGSIEEQREHLFETYARRMFERRSNEKYDEAKAVHYLRWLAGRMVERKQSVFYIENLQGDWIGGERARSLYNIVGRVAFGALGGLFVGVIIGLAILIMGFTIGELTFAELFTREMLTISLVTIGMPAAIGAGVFAASGILAFALDSTPDFFREPKRYVQRFAWTTTSGIILGGILTLLIVISGFIIFFTGTASYQSVSEFSTYFGDTRQTGWEAIRLSMFFFTLFGMWFGGIVGAVSTTIATATNLFKKMPNRVMNFDASYSVSDMVYEKQKPQHSIWSKFQFGLVIILGLITAFIASGTLVLGGYAIERTFYEAGKFIFVVSLSSIPTAIFVLLLSRIARRFTASLPYIIMGSGTVVYIFFAVIVNSLGESYDAFYNWYDIVWFILFAVGCGLIGLLVGRITDDVVSAEALSWRWSWRWTIVGILGAIVVGGFVLFDDFKNLNRYSPSREAQMQIEIDNRTEQIAEYQILLNENQVKADSYLAQFERPEQLRATLIQYMIASTKVLDRWSLSSACGDTDVWHHPDYNRRIAYDGWDEYQTDLLQKLERDWSGYDIASNISYLRNVEACTIKINQMQRWNRRTYLRYMEAGINESFKIDGAIALVIGLSIVIAGGIVGGLRKTEVVEIRTEPNSGMRRTFFTAIRVTLAFGTVGLFIGGAVGLLLSSFHPFDVPWSEEFHAVILPFTLVLSTSIGFSLGLLMGGTDALVKHGILRLFLMWNKSIPLNYAKVLNFATDSILLRRVGGGYIFVHRYLLEHFADREHDTRKSKNR